MTPLAHQILRSMVVDGGSPKAQNIAKLMDGIVCFDVSQVTELADDIAHDAIEAGTNLGDIATFLPSPKTWIETNAEPTHPNGRIGFLLAHHNLAVLNESEVLVSMFFSDQRGIFHQRSSFALDLAKPNFAFGRIDQSDPNIELIKSYAVLLLGCLAIINSPQSLGRRTHPPHRGLAKSLRQNVAVIGQIELRPYHEIVLEAAPPKVLSDLPGYQSNLVGKKCLHFCRAFLRMKNGRVEFVRAHWRGDHSRGVARSRYRIISRRDSDD